MNKKELEFILQEGEGFKIEFKEKLSGIDKDIVAFSNASGGRIFLGVNDDNEIVGINITNKLKSEVLSIARNCDPLIEIKLEKFEDVLIIEVEEGVNKPYKCKEGFFMRIGSNSQKMSRDEILDLAIGEGKIKFDSQINSKFNFKEDFDEDKLDEYLKLAKMTKNISVDNILVSLGVASKEGTNLKINNTGVLFFSKKSRQFFLTSKVVCVNYQTNEKVKILDKKIFDNGIINNIKDTIDYVQKHINVEYEIKKLERDEIPQYPGGAIRESIVNAIMHRDYFDDSGDILIEVFKNKIIISNPGGLVKGLKKEDFGTISRTRNPIIANLLSNTFYVEKLGTGINRIRTAMKNAELPQPEFNFNGSFFITDKNYLKEKAAEKVTGRVTEKVTGRVTENQTKILTEISKNKFITTKELSLIIGISGRKIKENISKLKQKGLLRRIGPAKGGFWEIKEK